MSGRRSHIAMTAAALLAVVAMAACTADGQQQSSPSDATEGTMNSTPSPRPNQPVTTIPASTTTAPPRLVWSDEFDGPAGTTPDPSRWAFDIGGDGWGNRQLEYYSDTNAVTDGAGNLRITSNALDVTTAPSCWYGACHFMSSRLTTAGLAAWQYGRFEMRASFPAGEATWPAFWMLGADFREVGWPASGEIDVVEHVGRDGGMVRGTAHGPGYSGGGGVTGSVDVGNTTDFHVYAVEWGPQSIVWFADGVEYHRLDNDGARPWVFDHEFYLVIDLAVGGLLGGEPGPADFQPMTYAIDYVRVYAP
jgi:beta-glucanase (GH16 family)